MGAMVTIKYTASLEETQAQTLAKGLKSLVEEAIGGSDVFVYADAARIAVGAEPLEVFIQVNSNKITDPTQLINDIADRLAEWKRQNSFEHLINLNVIPVQWHSKIGI